MNIYIEASSFYGKRSGVGRYGLSVTQALAKIRAKDTVTLFSFLRPGRQIIRDFSMSPNTRVRFIRWFPGRGFSLLMRKGISLPLELFGLWQADVLVFPVFVAWASLLGKKRVAVVHDLAFLHYPEFIQSKNLAYMRSQLPKSLKRAAAIVAVSEATKSDIVEHYGIDPEKISVVHNAVDGNVFSPKAGLHIKKVTKKYHLPEQYLLFVGNVEPRKNVEGLLRAYAASYPSHQLPLVVVGDKGWNDQAIEKTVAEMSELPIYLTGFVPDDDLASLYCGAVAFVYPSFYEGFGIPTLEAMASGCPVICSNVSSFPEIVGDAALQIDPHDTDAMTKAIISITSDNKLRQRLVTAGEKQARKFSWEDSAKKLSTIIEGLQQQNNVL